MLPEAGVGVMQEPCKERECSGSSPTLDIVKKEPPSWTPEDFLQSTLHEGKGIVCPAGGSIETIKPSRGRRKQQWKLKFHHQALPPEYLVHYEASLNKTKPPMANSTPPQTNQTQQRNSTTSSSAQTDCKNQPPYELNNLPNESIHNWLQRITTIQNEIQKSSTSENSSPSTGVANVSNRRRRTPVSANSASSHTSAAAKVLNYRDLPYMGEMTLNNSKPRRGRKPKKADICHLIYKNYGTIFPGTPSHLVEENVNVANFDKNLQTIKQEKTVKNEAVLLPNKQRTDLQNKIISSLLEKRLSQEHKKTKDTKVKKSKCVQVSSEEQHVESISSLCSPSAEIEPLNLCVRDLNNLKIRLLRKHGNVYAKANAVPKIEPPDEEDCVSPEIDCDSSIENETLNIVADSSSPRLPGDPDFSKLYKKILRESVPSGDVVNALEKQDVGAESPLPGGYVYWPNAGVFVHPLALQSQLLYYQGLAAGNSYTLPPPEPNSATAAITTANSSSEVEQQPSPTASSDSSTPSTIASRNKRTTNNNPNQTPTKRKRSAIFIPPVAADTSTSPATEVSICKFKFTGGARPSLQEKKMLSVDSGGNFRYYSGTGDKASRGYEFFPRETVQQAGGVVPLTNAATPSTNTASTDTTTRKKRKSRKSLQREKLEQTFKEKGFLIQTQQLESAEGATYCKFRQLRKFTRYLFRSWKDYLPGAMNSETESAPQIQNTS